MSNEADRTAPKITLTVAQIQHLARLAEAARFSGSLTVGAPGLLALCTLALQAEAMQPRPGRGIYIASKTVHAPKWRDLRKFEHQIISTWIDEAGVGETADFSDLWRRCIEEASNCATLICYRETGEVLKGAFVEIGAALANNRPVICVGDFEGMSFTSHRLVTTAPSVVAAITSLPEPRR